MRIRIIPTDKRTLNFLFKQYNRVTKKYTKNERTKKVHEVFFSLQ